MASKSVSDADHTHHSTLSNYINHKCRCDACVESKTCSPARKSPPPHKPATAPLWLKNPSTPPETWSTDQRLTGKWEELLYGERSPWIYSYRRRKSTAWLEDLVFADKRIAERVLKEGVTWAPLWLIEKVDFPFELTNEIITECVTILAGGSPSGKFAAFLNPNSDVSTSAHFWLIKLVKHWILLPAQLEQIYDAGLRYADDDLLCNADTRHDILVAIRNSREQQAYRRTIFGGEGMLVLPP